MIRSVTLAGLSIIVLSGTASAMFSPPDAYVARMERIVPNKGAEPFSNLGIDSLLNGITSSEHAQFKPHVKADLNETETSLGADTDVDPFLTNKH